MDYSARAYSGIENESLLSKFKKNWLYILAMSIMFTVGSTVVITVAKNSHHSKPPNSDKINNPDGF